MTQPILLSDVQCAELLGVSERTFQKLRSEPWMPKPVVLGPRLLRWVRTELEEAVGKAPRSEEMHEPEQLSKSRSKRMR